MILAGKLPPDRAALARARLARAEEAAMVDPGPGPPAVGRQRSHADRDDGIDIVIVGTPTDEPSDVEDVEPADGVVTPG